MKDASLSSDYHPGSFESDRESVAGKRGDRLTAPSSQLHIAKHCKALQSIAKHCKAHQTLQLVVSQCLNILQGGGVYSVHSKEPLSMSS